MSLKSPVLAFAGLLISLALQMAGCGSATNPAPAKNKPLAADGFPPDYPKIRGKEIAVSLFDELTEQQQSDYLSLRIKAAIAINNLVCKPFAEKMEQYYLTIPQGRKKSQGMSDFDARLHATKELAKKGGKDAPDLNQVSIDDMLLKLNKDKFPSYYQERPNPEQVEGLRHYQEMSDLINKAAAGHHP